MRCDYVMTASCGCTRPSGRDQNWQRTKLGSSGHAVSGVDKGRLCQNSSKFLVGSERRSRDTNSHYILAQTLDSFIEQKSLFFYGPTSCDLRVLVCECLGAPLCVYSSRGFERETFPRQTPELWKVDYIGKIGTSDTYIKSKYSYTVKVEALQMLSYRALISAIHVILPCK